MGVIPGGGNSQYVTHGENRKHHGNALPSRDTSDEEKQLANRNEKNGLNTSDHENYGERTRNFIEGVQIASSEITPLNEIWGPLNTGKKKKKATKTNHRLIGVTRDHQIIRVRRP